MTGVQTCALPISKKQTSKEDAKSVVSVEQADTESVEEEKDDTESVEEENAESVEGVEQAESEQEEELFEIDIDDITYCTNDENNGSIYELKDGDVGDKVGYFKEGEPFFYADEN